MPAAPPDLTFTDRSKLAHTSGVDLAIPAALNAALLVGSVAVACGCLWLASHATRWPGQRLGGWPLAIAAAIVFSYVANTIFSLMHEAVHGSLNPSRRLNEIGGRIASAFFPTAFALQRVFHEAHHRNNRSDLERFDYYAPHENRLLKTAQWYSILTGLYWLAPPTFALVYMLIGPFVDWNRLFSPGSRFARQTSAAPFLDSLCRVSPRQAQIDAAFSLAVQAALMWALDLSLAGWLLCYAFFGVSWSSLQYADHAFSTLDREEGAWNLRFNPVARLMFLNYNLHLNHHRSPGTPWIHLPRLTRPDDPAISFWGNYLRMWRGPRPLPAEAPSAEGARA